MNPLHVAILDAEGRAKSGEWHDARAHAVVGLFAMMHRKVYGGLPLDLEQAENFRIATRAANAIVKRVDDDVVEVIEMMKWKWSSEAGRLKWFQEREMELRSPINWRIMFSLSMLTNYRTAKATRAGAK